MSAEDEDALAPAMSEFVRLCLPEEKEGSVHPLPFLRVVSEEGRMVRLCPRSWPNEVWSNLIIEQIVADTSGMQPRFWHNELPWLMQPAVYTDCVFVVSEAKKVAEDYEREQKERRDGV